MSAPYPYPGPARPVPAAKPAWGPRLAVIGTSLALYVAACVTPALIFSGADRSWNGGGLLFFGWMGVVDSQFGWFANPIYALALLLVVFRKWAFAVITGSLALLVALNTLTLFFQEIPADEAGVATTHLVYLHVGFFLWIASIGAAIVGTLWLAFRDRRG